MAVNVEFTTDKNTGASPLNVTFTATVTFSKDLVGRIKVKNYMWYFDNDDNPTEIITTTTPIINHVYTGKNGQTYSVKLKVTLESK
jgi:PKD repeat protein